MHRNGEVAQEFIYDGHGATDTGEMVLGDPDNGWVDSRWLNQVLYMYADIFDANMTCKFLSCCSASGPNAMAQTFANHFPDAAVYGWTGLDLPVPGTNGIGFPNNSFTQFWQSIGGHKEDVDTSISKHSNWVRVKKANSKQ